jgi:hypothetical protein
MIGCMIWIHHLYWSAIFTAGWVFLSGIVLMILPRCGEGARGFCEVLIRAPGLDVVVSLLTWVPWVVAWSIGGWGALVGSLVGGAVGMVIWCVVHELMHLSDWRGPRIVKSLNRLVGRWRNHAALWATVIALPGFFFIRLHEYACYPLLVWILGFPRYEMGQWVNVSRQKFSGLVGHDLVWCLYCDWMTGVYSLGAEMLRNVEFMTGKSVRIAGRIFRIWKTAGWRRTGRWRMWRRCSMINTGTGGGRGLGIRRG